MPSVLQRIMKELKKDQGMVTKESMFSAASGDLVTDAMHKDGVNMRFLGLAFKRASENSEDEIAQELQLLILCEMISRTAAGMIRKHMREICDAPPNRSKSYARKALVLHFLKLLGANAPSSLAFWKEALMPAVYKKYPMRMLTTRVQDLRAECESRWTPVPRASGAAEDGRDFSQDWVSMIGMRITKVLGVKLRNRSFPQTQEGLMVRAVIVARRWRPP